MFSKKTIIELGERIREERLRKEVCPDCVFPRPGKKCPRDPEHGQCVKEYDPLAEDAD